MLICQYLESNEPIRVLTRDDPVICNQEINLCLFSYTVHRIQMMCLFSECKCRVIHRGSQMNLAISKQWSLQEKGGNPSHSSSFYLSLAGLKDV